MRASTRTRTSDAPLLSFWQRDGYPRTATFTLCWELNSDPMTDDYTPEEITAVELWQLWIERYAKPTMRIWWFVDGSDAAVFEFAPFQRREHCGEEHFLTYFTWPRDQSGAHIRWTDLPVADKLWRPGRADKGGFIQSATGWKPTPLQQTADIALIADGGHGKLPGRRPLNLPAGGHQFCRVAGGNLTRRPPQIRT